MGWPATWAASSATPTGTPRDTPRLVGAGPRSAHGLCRATGEGAGSLGGHRGLGRWAEHQGQRTRDGSLAQLEPTTLCDAPPMSTRPAGSQPPSAAGARSECLCRVLPPSPHGRVVVLLVPVDPGRPERALLDGSASPGGDATTGSATAALQAAAAFMALVAPDVAGPLPGLQLRLRHTGSTQRAPVDLVRVGEAEGGAEWLVATGMVHKGTGSAEQGGAHRAVSDREAQRRDWTLGVSRTSTLLRTLLCPERHGLRHCAACRLRTPAPTPADTASDTEVSFVLYNSARPPAFVSDSGAWLVGMDQPLFQSRVVARLACPLSLDQAAALVCGLPVREGGAVVGGWVAVTAQARGCAL